MSKGYLYKYMHITLTKQSIVPTCLGVTELKIENCRLICGYKVLLFAARWILIINVIINTFMPHHLNVWLIIDTTGIINLLFNTAYNNDKIKFNTLFKTMIILKSILGHKNCMSSGYNFTIICFNLSYMLLFGII